MNDPAPLDWSRLRRMLIVLPSWVGDATMATPLLRAVRGDERMRGAHLAGYMRPGLDELLDGCDLLDEMIVGRPAGLVGPWREGRRLARGRFDVVILLPNSWRLAATMRLARIPTRIGYNRDARGWMLTHSPPCPTAGGWKAPISAIDYYLAMGRSIGMEADDRRMMLRASEAQRRAAEKVLGKAGIGPGDSFAVLNPGASKAEKRWPAERFAALADHLAESHGMKVLISGSPAERLLVQEIVAQAKRRPIDLAALGVTLGSLKAILPRARLLVTNDTGTRHIAAASANADATDPSAASSGPNGGRASPLKILSLFGPTDPRWAAIDDPREHQLTAADQRMEGITLSQVAAKCDELLGHAV